MQAAHRTNLSPTAITIGDVTGIGPEIILKAFRRAPDMLRGCFVVGDLAVMQRANQLLHSSQDNGARAIKLTSIASAHEWQSTPTDSLPVLTLAPLSPATKLRPPAPEDGSCPLTKLPYGKINAHAGQFAAHCVQWAARAALHGEVAAIVTAPLHKEALAAAGVAFPGHTELLQFEAAAHAKLPLHAMPVRMMLANDLLRTVLVSIHLPLAHAIAAVNFDNILETLRITHTALFDILGRAPRMAVAGLNPHAGEGGLFGREELDIIQPTIQAAQQEGLLAQGPFAPDTVFARAMLTADRTSEFDVVIAMYHDQGLIPIKLLGIAQGVNVTLGLYSEFGSLIRTSPDHGTAFDIAGTGKADESSLLAAIRMAKQMAHSKQDTVTLSS